MESSVNSGRFENLDSIYASKMTSVVSRIAFDWTRLRVGGEEEVEGAGVTGESMIENSPSLLRLAASTPLRAPLRQRRTSSNIFLSMSIVAYIFGMC